jgi:hypothetical protein
MSMMDDLGAGHAEDVRHALGLQALDQPIGVTGRLEEHHDGLGPDLDREGPWRWADAGLIQPPRPGRGRHPDAADQLFCRPQSA